MVDWTVLGVPIDSVGRSGGTELAPAALREAGLVERLGIADRGDVDVCIRGEERDSETGIVGSPDVLRMTVTMRSAIRSMLSSGQRPLVLGGCCSLVPGAMAGSGVIMPAEYRLLSTLRMNRSRVVPSARIQALAK